MLYAIVGLLFLLADQFLKFWTVGHIELNAYPGKELIPGVLNLTYIKNAGAAFGLFSKFGALRWVLLALLIAFTAFIVLGISKRFLRTGFARWTGTLLLAGLLGNGVDRAVYGYVVDMFEPKLGSISWPIFNLADCLVVIFGILFCIALIAGGIGSPDPYEDEDEEEYLDDEEEEERPRRRRFGRRKDEDEEEEEDEEDEEEEERPRRRRRVREEDAEEPVRRRPRRVKETEDDTVEAPAPRRRPTAQQAEAVVRQPRREAPESDATVRTVERPAARPERESEQAPAPKAEPRPVQAPAPKAEPKPAAPAPAEPPKAESEDEFDLDSILAEFK